MVASDARAQGGKGSLLFTYRLEFKMLLIGHFKRMACPRLEKRDAGMGEGFYLDLKMWHRYLFGQSETPNFYFDALCGILMPVYYSKQGLIEPRNSKFKVLHETSTHDHALPSG